MNFQKTILLNAIILSALTAAAPCQAMFHREAETSQPTSPRTAGAHRYIDQVSNAQSGTQRRILNDAANVLRGLGVDLPARNIKNNQSEFDLFKRDIKTAVSGLSSSKKDAFVAGVNAAFTATEREFTASNSGARFGYTPLRVDTLSRDFERMSSASSTQFAPTPAAASMVRPTFKSATLPLTVSQGVSSTASSSTSRALPFNLETPLSKEEGSSIFSRVYTPEEQAILDSANKQIWRIARTADHLDILGTQHALPKRTEEQAVGETLSRTILAGLNRLPSEEVLPVVNALLRSWIYKSTNCISELCLEDPVVRALYRPLHAFLTDKKSQERPNSESRTRFREAISQLEQSVKPAPRPLPKNVIDRFFSAEEATILHRSVTQALEATARQEESAPKWIEFANNLQDYLLQRTPEEAATIYWEIRAILHELPLNNPAQTAPITDRLQETLTTLQARTRSEITRGHYDLFIDHIQHFWPS